MNNSININIQQGFNLLSFYNSKIYQSSIKTLKRDPFLFSMFKKRIEFLSLDKKIAMDKINKMALRYSVKLTNKQNFDSKLYRDNYENNNYDSYDLNQIICDFKYNIYLLKNLVLAKNTINKRFIFLKNIIECQGNDFIKKGYQLDFYCHDYSQIIDLENDKTINNYVWFSSKQYLSTHIMLKSDYKKFIKSVGGSYLIVDLESLKEIKQ